MEPKDGRLRIGDPFGPARPSDDDESSSWPSPTSRGTKRGRDIVVKYRTVPIGFGIARGKARTSLGGFPDASDRPRTGTALK